MKKIHVCSIGGEGDIGRQVSLVISKRCPEKSVRVKIIMDLQPLSSEGVSYLDQFREPGENNNHSVNINVGEIDLSPGRDNIAQAMGHMLNFTHATYGIKFPLNEVVPVVAESLEQSAECTKVDVDAFRR